MDKSISEMNVLITGSSRGIGAAIAVKFASMGFNVIIHYRSSHEAANETARRCLSYGGKVLTISADLQDREQVSRMKEKLENHQLMPDVLVNNAGIAHYGLFTETTEKDWDQLLDVNLKSLFLCTQTFLPHMIGQKYGRVINLSSIWGLSGGSCETIYSATKGGVNAFTKALAKELASSGITVNAVAPGAVDTDMLGNLDEQDLSDLKLEIPAGRLGQPDEIASLIYFIALPESSYITGQVISPNGGWLT